MALDSLISLCWSSRLDESMTLMSFSVTLGLAHAHAGDAPATHGYTFAETYHEKEAQQ